MKVNQSFDDELDDALLQEWTDEANKPTGWEYEEDIENNWTLLNMLLGSMTPEEIETLEIELQ